MAKVSRPTLLMQAKFGTLPDGTLDGAMSGAEAARAAMLLSGGRYLKVDASHVVNLDKPEVFLGALLNFFHE